MTQIIEIEGDLVRVVERNVRSQANLADVLPHIETRIPISMPIMPRNRTPIVRFDPRDPTNMRLDMFMELPPGVRTIQVNRHEQVRIALPWTVFYFRITANDGNPQTQNWAFNEWACFHSKDQLVSLDQKLIPAMLPNVFGDGRICYGTTAVDANQPLHDRLDELVNSWYISNFNNIGHVRGSYMPWGSAGGDYTKWVDETNRSASCWRTWPEWDETTPEGANQQHLTPLEIIDVEMERTTPIRLEGAIPDLPLALTFGRADEWLRGLTNNQRLRLHNALATLQREGPDLFTPGAD